MVFLLSDCEREREREKERERERGRDDTDTHHNFLAVQPEVKAGGMGLASCVGVASCVGMLSNMGGATPIAPGNGNFGCRPTATRSPSVRGEDVRVWGVRVLVVVGSGDT